MFLLLELQWNTNIVHFLSFGVILHCVFCKQIWYQNGGYKILCPSKLRIFPKVAGVSSMSRQLVRLFGDRKLVLNLPILAHVQDGDYDKNPRRIRGLLCPAWLKRQVKIHIIKVFICIVITVRLFFLPFN